MYPFCRDSPAWATFNSTGTDIVSTLAYHFAGSSINPSYVTPNHTLVSTGRNNSALPNLINGTTSVDPLVVVRDERTKWEVIRGSDWNASVVGGGEVVAGVRVVGVVKVSSARVVVV